MITIADIFCKRQLDIINKQSLFAPENYRGEKKKKDQNILKDCAWCTKEQSAVISHMHTFARRKK